MSRTTRYADTASVLLPTLVIAIAATVSALRLPLSRDELATLLFAKQPGNELLSAVSHVDAVFGPYYAVTHAVYSVIPNAFGIRLLSVLAATGAVLVVSLVARRWWGSLPALIAGLALATNPLFQQMASTARSYALATFFVALAVLLLDHALRTGRVAAWLGYGAAVAAAGYSHLFALLTVPGMIAFAIAAGRRRLLTTILVSAAGSLLVIPVALGAYSQHGQVSWIQRPDLKSALGSIASALVYRSEGRFQAIEAVVLLLTLCVLATGAILTLRMTRSATRIVEIRRFALALGIAFGPWLILLVVSLAITPYLRTNYLTPSLVGIALGLGAASQRVREVIPLVSRRRSLLVGGAIVAFVAVGAVPVVQSAIQVAAPWRVDNFPGLAADLRRVVSTGDVIVFVQPFAETGVDAGSASYLGDDRFLQETVARVATGTQPVLDIRRVTATDPVRSVSVSRIPSGSAIWIVHTRSAYNVADGRALTSMGVACAAPSQLHLIGSYGLMRLERVACS